MKTEIIEKIEQIKKREAPEGYKSTKVGIIPHEWHDKNIGNIIEETRLGGNYTNSEEDNGLPLIKIGNIGRGNIVLDDLNYITDGIASEDDLLKEGDLLFNTRNTLELVGKVAV